MKKAQLEYRVHYGNSEARVKLAGSNFDFVVDIALLAKECSKLKFSFKTNILSLLDTILLSAYQRSH